MKSELMDEKKSLRYITATWPAPKNVKAFVTTRRGGYSTGAYESFNMGLRCGDDVTNIWLNRHQMISDWNWSEPLLWIKQVHGTRIVSAVNDMNKEVIEADGVWSNKTGAVCLVLSADCMPVFLCSISGRCVAAVHVGWRGLSAGILEEAIAALSEKAENIMAWLGPSITTAFFEVGPEVRDAFVKTMPESKQCFTQGKGDRWYADLYHLARQRLKVSGVLNVYGAQYCTWQNKNQFYSYRRDGKASGRMAAAIWIEE